MRTCQAFGAAKRCATPFDVHTPNRLRATTSTTVPGTVLTGRHGRTAVRVDTSHLGSLKRRTDDICRVKDPRHLIDDGDQPSYEQSSSRVLDL
jgi:hypothetical protein